MCRQLVELGLLLPSCEYHCNAARYRCPGGGFGGGNTNFFSLPCSFFYLYFFGCRYQFLSASRKIIDLMTDATWTHIFFFDSYLQITYVFPSWSPGFCLGFPSFARVEQNRFK